MREPSIEAGGAPATSSVPRLFVLLTVHNRKAVTLACLERLADESQDARAKVQVVLVDDASTDGTAAAVRERFPEVQVVEGSGNLFWNGGMRRAYEVAAREDPEYYLLLNDDTRLLAGAIRRMLATHEERAGAGDAASIIVGSTVDPGSGRWSYGGWLRGPRLNPGAFRPVEPGSDARPCHTMNCNCVLVPRQVARSVGNLDGSFTHSMGDLDYGLRALRAGCSLWVAPGYIGECAANTGKGLWVEPSLAGRERWRRLLGPKGLPPGEWLVFTYRHFGTFWPLHFAWPYLSNAWKTLRVWLAAPTGRKPHS